MIKELVLLRFRQEVAEDERQRLLQGVVELGRVVPGVRVDSGPALETPEAGRFSHALDITFDSAQVREEYLPHPAHLAAAKPLVDAAAEVLSFEFTVDSSAL